MSNKPTGMLPAISHLTKTNKEVSLVRFISAIIAETIYASEDWFVISAYPLYDPTIQVIKVKCSNDAGKFYALKGYNRDSLYSLIEREWTELDNVNYLPKGVNCWAYSYDEQTGSVSFAGFMAKKREVESIGKQYNIPMPSCGDGLYVKQEETAAVDNTTAIDNSAIENEAEEISVAVNTGAVDGAECSVDEGVEMAPEEPIAVITNTTPEVCKTRTSTRRMNIPDGIVKKITDLYDKLVNSRGGSESVKNLEYIWQWRISANEYDEICRILTSVEYRKYIKKLYKINKKCLFIVVAYVAERYKREWNGNNGKDNALKQIGLNGPNDSEEIATLYFAYKLNRIFQHKGSRSNEWLDSLRIEGGLPINYIVNHSDEGNRVLVKFAEKIYKDSAKAIENLQKNSKNQILKWSYEKGYSIREYVDALTQKDIGEILNVDDLEKYPFAEFRTILEEERKRASNKFVYKYRIWKCGDEFILYRNMALAQSKQYDEDCELISRERINRQCNDIKLADNELIWLEIGGKDYEFHPWMMKYYRSAIGLDEFALSLEKAPNCRVSKEIVRLKSKGGECREFKSVEKFRDNYISFASYDGYRWETDIRGSRKAVLVLDDKIALETEHSEEEKVVGEGVRWVEYYDRIKVGGKYIYGSNATVVPNNIVKHIVSKSKYIRKVQSVVDGRREDVYVLLDVGLDNAENFERVSGGKEGLKHKCEAVEGIVGYGPTRLKIDGIRMNAYILPGSVQIQRDCRKEGGTITITNLRQIDSGFDVSTNLGELVQTDGGWQIKDKYAPENSHIDTLCITLKLPDKTGLEIDIVRPLDRDDKMLDHTIIEANRNIPIKLASQYKKRIFDNDGVRYIDDYSSRKRYSHRIQHYGGKLLVAQGRHIVVEEGVEFVCLKYDETTKKLVEEPIALKEELNRDIYSRYLDVDLNSMQQSWGVLVQSLQHNLPHLTYYEPYWIINNDNEKYDLLKRVPAVDRLILSLKHKLYFTELLFKDDVSPELFQQYVEYCDNLDIKPDWAILWRVANELEASWWYIRRAEWRDVIHKNDYHKQTCVRELLKHSPVVGYRTLAENFWDMPGYNSDVWRRRGRCSDALKYLAYIFSTDGKCPSKLPSSDDINEELDKITNK